MIFARSLAGGAEYQRRRPAGDDLFPSRPVAILTGRRLGKRDGGEIGGMKLVEPRRGSPRVGMPGPGEKPVGPPNLAHCGRIRQAEEGEGGGDRVGGGHVPSSFP